MKIHFDGVSKTIIVDASHRVKIESVYAYWKDWVRKENNIQFLPAFVIENNIYYLINDWDIRPKDNNGILYISGNVSIGER